MNGRPWILALGTVVAACDCESTSYVAGAASATESDASSTEGDATTSTAGASGVLAGTSEGTTGAPFDASRWLGRYHYQDPVVDIWTGQDQTSMLVNLEIREDGTMTAIYDHCTFDWPETIHYAWEPDEEPGWIELHPGVGETSLRFMSGYAETIRAHLIEPCRALEFEFDGVVDGWLPFHPGSWCWRNRCGLGIRADYCEGEEPPPCP